MNCMNEVTKVSSLAAHWTMIIFAWYGPIITDLNQLILNFLLFLNLFNILIFENLNLAFDALDSMLVVKSQLNERHGFYLSIGHLVECLYLLLNLGLYLSLLLLD